MSLQTGTELVSFALLINKITGVYGLLAILTGYSISALQLSMYLYSVLCVVALAFLLPHVRRQTPFQNLALAWLYILDTAVNTAYTTSFAVAWYMAGFHDPKGTAGADAAPPQPTATGLAIRDDAAAAAAAGNVTTSTGGGEDDGRAAQARETAVSMVLIVALTLVRVYFAAVVAAHARAVILRFVEGRPSSRDVDDVGRKGSRAANPFARGTAEGEGLKGRLGRSLIAVGAGYWLGVRPDEEWARDVGNKFRARGHGGAAGGSAERSAEGPGVGPA